MKTLHIASVAIINPNKELLLVCKKNSEFYQLTGGKIQNGEKDIETIIREAKEEIGLEIQPHQLTFLGSHQTKAVNENNTMVHGCVYWLNLPYFFEPVIANEIDKFVWMNKNNYQEYSWAHLAKELVQPKWLLL
mgnify:FL=1